MPPLISLYAPAAIVAALVLSSLVIFLFTRRALLSLALGLIGALGAYVYWTSDLLTMNLRANRECGADEAQILARRTDVSAVLLPADVSTLDPRALEGFVATYDVVVTDGVPSAGIPRQRWRPAAPSEFANYSNGKTRFVSVAVSEADLPRYRVIEQWSGPSEPAPGYKIESGEMRIEDRDDERSAREGRHPPRHEPPRRRACARARAAAGSRRLGMPRRRPNRSREASARPAAR